MSAQTTVPKVTDADLRTVRICMAERLALRQVREGELPFKNIVNLKRVTDPALTLAVAVDRWAELVAAIDIREGLDSGRYDYSVIGPELAGNPLREEEAGCRAADAVEDALNALCGRRPGR